MPLVPPLEFPLFGNEGLWKTLRQLSSPSIPAIQCLSSSGGSLTPQTSSTDVTGSISTSPSSPSSPSCNISNIIGALWTPPTPFLCINPHQTFHRFWFELHEFTRSSTGTSLSPSSSNNNNNSPSLSISPTNPSLLNPTPIVTVVSPSSEWYSHPYRIVLCLETTMLMIASAPSKEVILNDWESLVAKAGYQAIVEAALSLDR